MISDGATGGPEYPRSGPWTGNRLGLIFYFDTNFVDCPSSAAGALRDLDRDGWIELTRSDTVDTELGGDQDDARRENLLEATAGYAEAQGPMVWGHSRWDHSVRGNDDDAARLDRVFRILFPGTDRYSETGRAKRKLRDAMHVATAIRYGATTFITCDERDLVSKSDAIAAAFDSFRIVTPDQALAFVLRMKARYEYRETNPL